MAKRETMQHRVGFLITKTQYLAIKAAAERVGLGVSAYIRQAAIKEAAKGDAQ